MNEAVSAVPSLTAKAQKLRDRLIFERFAGDRVPFDPFVPKKKARIEDMVSVFNTVIIAEGGPIIEIARAWKREQDVSASTYHRTESCLHELVDLGLVYTRKVGRYQHYFASDVGD